MNKSRTIYLRGLALLHDFVVAGAAFLLSIALRIGADGLLANWLEFLTDAAGFALLVVAVGFQFGMNRGVWRYASIPDLVAITKTTTLATLLFVLAHFFLTRLELIPRSSLAVCWAFALILLAAPRAAYRLYRNWRDSHRRLEGTPTPAKRVLLVGANDNADVLLKVLAERPGGNSYEVLAIVDERERRTGRVIRGVPVVGGPEELPKLVARYEAEDRRPVALILTRSREEYQRHASLERLVELAGEMRLEMLRVPNLLDIQSIDSDLPLKPIRLEDLLQRPTIRHDLTGLGAMIGGKRVLITGAGGSIGAELARQVLTLSPASLTLVDASEFLLYSIETELVRSSPFVPISALLGNVRERQQIRRVIESARPEIVFHAAALKHVPIVEAQPLEGIHTNAIGTRNVAEACLTAEVKAMILISTDKAVNSANVMGASKRMAEMFCQALDVQSASDGTRFVTVRFGNVLGSAGSVVPLFETQIKAGGPVTVTHPDVERFFMTIPESCLLVLQAAAHALSQADQRGRIFVLDMGKPVKILDMARNMIRLCGKRPDVDVKIVYTGLRPGEKLYEELFASRETLVQTDVSSVMAAFPRPVDRMMIGRIFDEMEQLIRAHDVGGVLRLLRHTVSDFTPGTAFQALLDSQTGVTSAAPVTTSNSDDLSGSAP